MLARPLPLKLTQPFRIAHGTSTQRTNLLVELPGADGPSYGEGALPPYYPYDLDEVTQWVEALDAEALFPDPLALERSLASIPDGPAPARCAVDLALHDRFGKALGLPLHRILGLRAEDTPPSSVTLSIPESEAALREELARYAAWPFVKLKLGTGSVDADVQIVAAARAVYAGRLAVDANRAWSLDEAALAVDELGAFDLDFVEQPIQGDAPEEWRALRERLGTDAPPLVADESVQTARDVAELAPYVWGVNVKLAKTGGIAGARRAIAVARALGLRVMLGCMVESSLALTAAAHLSPLVDIADLDGSLTLAADPFAGVVLDTGVLTLPEGPGLGVKLH
jgi:L-alanine-DL-glutamate epimerase-like enolase superfamily enzyme